jgi:hypothetical protein
MLAMSLILVSLYGCGDPATSPSPPPPARAHNPNGPATPTAPPRPPPSAQAGKGSGAAMQDPTGFPPFHDWPAPSGPSIDKQGLWSAPVQLTAKPAGGYRPQIATGVDNTLHAVFYERTDAGDLIRHRTSADGQTWSAPAPLGHTDLRNWGPDIVAREDGQLVLVYDHALEDFQSRGFIARWKGGQWTTPMALTPDDGGEVGSGHIAHGRGETLAYVYIAKKLDPSDHFQARYRWHIDGTWGDVGTFTDGKVDAWHTNVERRPDGSMLAGWDVGMGGAETTVYVTEGREGTWSTPENISASSKPGERVHFAFGSDGRDHLTWFHKTAGRPQHIYVRSGKPGHWGAVEEPNRGYGGYHFDPDIAVNKSGVRCLVWGWDGGAQAELVYSIDRGQGWSPPARIASIGWGKPGLPSIDVDNHGRFHVIWNQGVRGYNEVYAATLEVL